MGTSPRSRPASQTSHHALRRAHADAQLATAVSTVLDRHGYVGLTIERVAQEAGVAKTTIYRRWGSKAEMVFDLMIHSPRLNEEPAPPADESLSDAVTRLSRRAVAMMDSPAGRSVIPGLLADMTSNERLRESMEAALVQGAQEDITASLGRHLPHPVNVNELHATLLGVPYVRIHLLGEDDTELIAAQLTTQLLGLVSPPSSNHPAAPDAEPGP